MSSASLSAAATSASITTPTPSTTATTNAATAATAGSEDQLRIGDRVRRGRDWRWGDQDNNGGIGTVVDVEDRGIARVRWDHDGRTNVYRAGIEGGKHDLKRVSSAPEVGLRVERAPPTGRASATIGMTGPKGKIVGNPSPGWVLVKWEQSERTEKLRWGANGVIELRVCPHDWPPQSGGLAIGTRVIRGESWEWGEQDGPSRVGTVVSLSSTRGWYGVRWDSGTTNQYRYLADGKKDLKVYVLNSGASSAAPAAAAATTTTTTPAAEGSDGAKATGDDGDEAEKSDAGFQTWVDDLPTRGATVVRNKEFWKWEHQDGGPGCLGTVLGKSEKTGWIRVRWNRSGYPNEYRFGARVRDVVVPPPAAPLAPVADANGFSPTEQCLGCVDRRRDCVVLPCAHLAMCFECVDKLTPRLCPICRGDILTTLRVFHA